MSTIVAASVQPRWKSVSLWIVRGLLAFVFLGAGGAKLLLQPVFGRDQLLQLEVDRGEILGHLPRARLQTIPFAAEIVHVGFAGHRFISQMAWAGINDVSVFPFSPYPGSELFAQLQGKQLITLDVKYFYSLSQYTDPRYIKTYCDRIPAQWLRLLCLSGMALFYSRERARCRPTAIMPKMKMRRNVSADSRRRACWPIHTPTMVGATAATPARLLARW